MIKLTIDNKPVEIEEGATILDAAAKLGIPIPTLCHNEELSPAGACRLCVVEIGSEKGSMTVSSCNYPVKDGLVVSTKSEMVVNARKMALEILLAQSPHSEKLNMLALSFGIEKPRFQIKSEECILCRLCVRTCNEVVGVGAITFMAQGINRENKESCVEWDADKCIACGSCAYICPTQAVTLSDGQATRVITTPNVKMEFSMKACSKCGSHYAPDKQLAYMSQASGVPIENFDLCMDCRE